MMDYTLPVAKRTRLKETEMWSIVHKEIKRKNPEQRANASVLCGFGGQSETLKERTSRGRPRKSNGGENLAPNRDHASEKGLACDCESNGPENLGCKICGDAGVRPVVLDDTEDDVVLVNEGEEEEEKEVIFIDDDDGGGGGLGDGVGSNGSEVAENNGFNFVSVKRETMEEDSNSGSKMDRSAKNRDALESRLQETGEDVGDGDSDEACFITDDSEEPEIFSSEEDNEDDEDSDDEDFSVSAEIEGVAEQDSRILEKLIEREKINNKQKKHTAGDKVDSVDCGHDPDCVAKRTVSHFSLDFDEKKSKLGNVCKPLPTNDGDAIAANKTCSIGQTDEPKKRKQTAKKKPFHAYKAHNFVKILADAMLDKAEIPCKDETEPFARPTLPLKFTFGIEELTTPEVPEDERELEPLWTETFLALEKGRHSVRTLCYITSYTT